MNLVRNVASVTKHVYITDINMPLPETTADVVTSKLYKEMDNSFNDLLNNLMSRT